jgi:hypothetical protein
VTLTQGGHGKICRLGLYTRESCIYSRLMDSPTALHIWSLPLQRSNPCESVAGMVRCYTDRLPIQDLVPCQRRRILHFYSPVRRRIIPLNLEISRFPQAQLPRVLNPWPGICSAVGFRTLVPKAPDVYSTWCLQHQAQRLI